MGADPRDCSCSPSPVPAALQQEPSEDKLSSTAGAGAGSQEPGIALFGAVGRSCRAAIAQLTAREFTGSRRGVTAGSAGIPPGSGRAACGGVAPGRGWVTRGRGWHNPMHDAAHGAPHASCSSAGRVPSGYFAGTAKRSPGKQIRSRARLKCLKLPVPRAGCAAQPSPEQPCVPAAPNYTAGPGGPRPAQLRGAGTARPQAKTAS